MLEEKIANDRLLEYANIYGVDIDLEQVSIKIMRAHADVSVWDADGWLTPRQIAEYHHGVLGKYGLPPQTFGGTPVTGQLWEADINFGWIRGYKYWCEGCAPK